MTAKLELGVRAHDFGQLPLAELIEKLKRYQMNHIQFAVQRSFPESASSLSNIHQGTAVHYGEAFRQAGIRIAVLGCYVNIIDPDVEGRREALHQFATHLRLSRDFGASLVGTETGWLKDPALHRTEEAFLEVVKSVEIMVKEAERFGATVGIEAVATHPLHSARLARRLLDLVPSNNLQIILDCVNLLSPENYEDRENVVLEALELLGDRVAVLHLKDCVLEGGAIKGVPIGQGGMNFAPILRFMKYDRPHLQGIMEETREENLDESIAYLRKLYEEV
ncbi:sugar phosphate isomerase/epimerase [Paenibacillus sp. PK3_47]|uniref:sugar phosphate isomerase/epimerase family protein n=1 Tax=Paenibacillus sp. PK3_47 TaxID=2072642 RepID=UPI00201DD853|nr:sugar phosphate isomerase/epimerase [Paenibacillus sp. PK3_47]UQZ36860.1 sugar phosphate isomerase/epimerase [Paenibacillus sp. PK3_47]